LWRTAIEDFFVAEKPCRRKQWKRNMPENLPPRVLLKKRQSANEWLKISRGSRITSPRQPLCGENLIRVGAQQGDV